MKYLISILLLLSIVILIDGSGKYNSVRGDSIFKEYMKNIDTNVIKNDSQHIRYFINVTDMYYVDGYEWVKDYKFVDGRYNIIPTHGKPFWADKIQVIR